MTKTEVLISYFTEKKNVKPLQGDCFHPNMSSSSFFFFFFFCCLKPQGNHSLSNPASTSETLGGWILPSQKSLPVQHPLTLRLQGSDSLRYFISLSFLAVQKNVHFLLFKGYPSTGERVYSFPITEEL